MLRFLPVLCSLALVGCVLPAWPPPWADDDTVADDDTTAGDDDDDITADDDDDTLAIPLEWVPIPGSSFDMGSEDGDHDETPVHPVDVPAFEMMREEVTNAEYAACVDAGGCTLPEAQSGGCEGMFERGDDYPVSCATWQQAHEFCTWRDGRLPSEAEWEYAARSGGRDIDYPWGDEQATCVYAIMHDDDMGGSACGLDLAWEGCNRSPTGDTDQGLCDMSGNLWEWVHDWYHSTYIDAPADGSPWVDGGGSARVTRGGSCGNNHSNLRAANRDYSSEDSTIPGLGFRCARDP